jgi:hypothetical protein
MPERKEFSVLKWIVFPAISITLAGVIAWFNIQVFGLEDGLPYVVIVLLIAGFSIIINKYTESQNNKLVIAAFVCEIFLTAALIGNAAYSLSVQRKMSVARTSDQTQTQTIERISRLRGRRAQEKAIDKMGAHESAEAVFAGYEQVLFWIMIGELSLFGVCAFTLFGIAKILGATESAPAQTLAQQPDLTRPTSAPSQIKTPPQPNPVWRGGQRINGKDQDGQSH